MANILRIGTRDSKLAVWQAEQVQNQLSLLGVKAELRMVKVPADKDLSTPLHQFGGTGLFTKILDDALLAGEIDLAVHSLKDYPTLAPEGISLEAVLPRASALDILVHKGNLNFLKAGGTVATGSIRRVAQWKHRYPNHQTTGLRGNVQTRLKKLLNNDWDGAIFAKAGLERINELPAHYEELDWMIPAPAQGVIAITCLSQDDALRKALQKLCDKETFKLAMIERDFLRGVEGGCSAPVGALATLKDDEVHLQAALFALDGSQKVEVNRKMPFHESENLGMIAAQQALAQGGKEIMESLDNGGR